MTFRLPLALFILIFAAACSSKKTQPEILQETAEAGSAQVEQEMELKSVPLLSTVMAGEVPWSYKGGTGAEHWHHLDPAFSLCESGKRQSPINLVFRTPKGHQEIIFDIRDSVWTLMDRQPFFVIQPGRVNTTYFSGTSYTLREITLHAPAEHTFSGKKHPLEAHLYHESENGEVLVVSSVFKVGEVESLPLAQILKHIPLADSKDYQVVEPLSLGLLLPEIRSYYHYMGSLTFPPCTEGVHRVVFNTPIAISSTQLAQIRAILGENSRPIQPAGGRAVENFATPPEPGR